MDVCKYTLNEIIEKDLPVIGFYGAPCADALQSAWRRFPLAPFFNLGLHFGAPRSELVPDGYCAVVRNCIDNALAASHQLLCVVASADADACDAGRYAALVLEAHLDVPVITAPNRKEGLPQQPLLCESRGPLAERMTRVLTGIVSPLTQQERNKAFLSKCEPTAGYWGTPPHPASLLELFPPTTHILGWARCVEQNSIGDMSLEVRVPENVPTVFFAQAGCLKTLLAKELARKHNGLAIVADDALSLEQIEQIKTFLKDT